MNTDIGFRSDRLKLMMDKRDLKAGQLEYMTGVSQAMLSLMLNGKRTNPGGMVLAKLADRLGCSVDYLLGITDDPSPVRTRLNDQVDALVYAARHLPRYRQRDLLRLAETYARESNQDRMDTILGLVRELGGENAELVLTDFLESLVRDDPALPSQDEGDEGTEGGE